MKNQKIKVETQVNELYSKTIITQELRNNHNEPLELEAYINNKSDNYLFSSFNVQIGDSIKAYSKVIKEEKAAEKYTDEISSGNAAIHASYDKKNKKTIIHLGNIPPKENVVFISEFLQLLKTSNNHEYKIELLDIEDLPVIKGKNTNDYGIDFINQFLEIKTENKIEKIDKKDFFESLIVKEEKLNEEKNKYILKFNIDLCSSDLDKLMRSLNKDSPEARPFGKIIFKTEENYGIFLFSQISNKYKDEQNFMLNYEIREDDKLILNPGCFIILIDPKFYNKFTEEVFDSIRFFLYSIPAGSYFQIIIDCKSDLELPKEYNEKNIEECLKYMEAYESNQSENDLLNNLKKVFESKNKFKNLGVPKYIYLFTEGDDINEKNGILNIVENNNNFSIHIFGDNANVDFLKKVAEISNGNYASYTNITNLSEIIISDLIKISYPYIYNFDINSSLDKISQYNLNPKKEIMKLNKIYNFKYITKEKINDSKNIDFTIKYILNKNNFLKRYKLSAIELPEGEELFKLNMYDYIKNNENLSPEEKIKLALKYQILIEGTSFFTQVELSGKIISPMKLSSSFKSNKSFVDKDKINDDINKHFKKPLNDNPENIIDDKNYNPNIKESQNEDLDQMYHELLNDEKKIQESNNYNMNRINKSESNPEKEYQKSNLNQLGDSHKEIIKPSKNEGKLSQKILKDEQRPNEDIQGDNDLDLMLQELNEPFTSVKKEHLEPDDDMDPYKSRKKENLENDDELDYMLMRMNDPYMRGKKEKIEEISKEDVNGIIFSQNIYEGYWDINPKTEIVKNILSINAKNLKEANYDDITAMTILMIYFLSNGYGELSGKLAMIIIKAKLYIKNKIGVSYKKIFKKVCFNELD